MNYTVLVVEDSALQRHYATQLCRDYGVADIISAAEGLEALQRLRERQGPVDIALVDLEMPGMDGVALLRHLAKEKLAHSVVIVSSKDSSLVGSVGMMAEADGMNVLAILRKPLSAQAIATTFSRYIGPKEKTVESVAGAKHFSAADIKRAVEAKEFFLQYQPKVTLRSGLLKGVESLIRWRHPELGIIAPVQFIAIAEQNGLMDYLTRYILNCAFAQWSEWHRHGLKIGMAINLSPLSLEDENLADWILSLATQFDVDPRFLTLEITESAVINELAAAISTLAQLRLKGFGVSIDDFGTGAATTQQLSRMPVTELKIDRSLVFGCTTKPHLFCILENTVRLGQSLHLSTVAEGIETAEEWQALRQMGCEQAQGFYISRPMDAADLPLWIRTGSEHVRKQNA